MNIKRYLLSLALLSLLISNGVLAAQSDKSYIGAQYSLVTYSETGIPDYDMTALILRGGYNINEYFSVEGRYGFGIADDTHRLSSLDISLEVDNMYGIYALGRIPLSNNFDLYGVAGYTEVNFAASIPGYSVNFDESDFSVGAGAEFYLDSVSFSLEYMSYISKNDFDLNAIGVGINYNF